MGHELYAGGRRTGLVASAGRPVPIRCRRMTFSNPRLFAYILEGIGWSLSPNELDRLEKLARAHYSGSALDVLATAAAKRRHSLATSSHPANAESVRSIRPLTLFERMMDEVAAASSMAELNHIQGELLALFDAGPERDLLERSLAGKRAALLEHS